MKRYVILSIIVFCVIMGSYCYGASAKHNKNQQEKVTSSEVQKIVSEAKSVRFIFQVGEGYLSEIQGAVKMGLGGPPTPMEPCVWIFRAVPPEYAADGIKKDGAYINYKGKWQLVRMVDSQLSRDAAAALFGIQGR